MLLAQEGLLSLGELGGYGELPGVLEGGELGLGLLGLGEGGGLADLGGEDLHAGLEGLGGGGIVGGGSPEAVQGVRELVDGLVEQGQVDPGSRVGRLQLHRAHEGLRQSQMSRGVELGEGNWEVDLKGVHGLLLLLVEDADGAPGVGGSLGFVNGVAVVDEGIVGLPAHGAVAPAQVVVRLPRLLQLRTLQKPRLQSPSPAPSNPKGTERWKEGGPRPFPDAGQAEWCERRSRPGSRASRAA